MLKNRGQYVFFDGDYPTKVNYDGITYYFFEDLGKFAMYVSVRGVRGTFSKRDIWVRELDAIEKRERHEYYVKYKGIAELKRSAKIMEKIEERAKKQQRRKNKK